MGAKKIWPAQIMLMGLLVLVFYGLIACTPNLISSENSSFSQSQNAAVISSNDEPKSATPSIDEGIPSTRTLGQSNSSGGELDEINDSTALANREDSSSADMAIYLDPQYHYQIEYPTNFVLRPLSIALLAQMTPQPVAGLRFMHPDIAASDLGDQELADLEIHVFAVAPNTDLTAWLQANFPAVASGTQKPNAFQIAGTAGIEVCDPKFIGPGCIYYISGDGAIYRLIPATTMGETMIGSLQISSQN